MKIFSTILLGVSLAFVGAAGCKKGASELAPAEAIATKACACTTQESFMAAKAEFKAFENTLEDKYDKAKKEPPKSLEEQWGKIEDKAKKCGEALKAKLGGGSAAADPAAAPAAPAAAPAAPAAAPAAPAAGSAQ